jgi:hypothetical protein
VRFVSLAFVMLCVTLSTACMSWTPGWERAPIVSPVAPSTMTSSMPEVDLRFEEAGDARTLQEAIALYEGLLVSSPREARLLNQLSTAHILYGAAYATGRAEKGRWYRAGIRYAERAMSTNESFAAAVGAGKPIGEAVSLLGGDPAERKAMLLWVTGVSYYFKECAGVRALMHFRWMLKAREVMERLAAVDPTFDHGAVLFSLGIYHLALPPGAGRDMAKSGEFMERAVAAAGTSLLPRWGRARYFHHRTGNRQAFVEDLEWVIRQPSRGVDSPYPWNVYFQRDAAALLARVDELFPRAGR